jgi:hypothetical protein
MPGTKKYKLYAVDKYDKTKEWIAKAYKEYELNEAVNELANDCGYHMRTQSDRDIYTFYGDCDEFDGTFDQFADLLVGFLDAHYDIKITQNDISYTINKSKKGSYHYSIPKIHGSAKKIKEIHTNFFKKCEDKFANTLSKKKKVVDTCIYMNHWFRYPGQSKEGDKTTKHMIQRGSMVHFMVEHISRHSRSIEGKKYVIDPELKKSKTIKMIKHQIEKEESTKKQFSLTLPNLFQNHESVKKIEQKNQEDLAEFEDQEDQVDPEDRADQDDPDQDDPEIIELSHSNKQKKWKNAITTVCLCSPYKKSLLTRVIRGLNMYDLYDEWSSVGMALKNESAYKYEYFELFDQWSSRSLKYQGTADCKKKWNSWDQRNGDGYTICYLINQLEKRNANEYDALKHEWDSFKFLNGNKDKYYPNNECMVENIESSDDVHTLTIADSHCPIYKGIHETTDQESLRKFSICSRGKAFMECTNQKCLGKACPKEGIHVENKIVNNLFLNVNGDFITNINYGVNNRMHSVKAMLTLELRNHSIYETNELNEKMIKSFSGDNGIVEAISQWYGGKICFVDKSWYRFDTHVWKKCDNVITNIFVDFVKQYDKIAEFIKGSMKYLDVEKYEYNDQVDQQKEYILNIKKNHGIILLLSNKVASQQKFNSKKNLMAFVNGVYDFETHEFRNGHESDMITHTCQYKYSGEYEDKCSMEKSLKYIFGNDEILESFLKYLSTGLYKKKDNVDDIFLILQLQGDQTFNGQKMINLIVSAFGAYCTDTQNYNSLVKLSEHQLQVTKIVVVRKMNKFTQKEVNQYQIQNQCNDHLTLCVSEDDLMIDNNVEDKIGRVIIPSKNNDKTIISPNDFLLLLIEHMKKNNNDIFNGLKPVKPDNRTMIEKICDEFIKDEIAKNDGLTKATDVFKKFVSWSEQKGVKIGKYQFYDELKKHFIYSPSASIYNKTTFKHEMTSCFNMTLKNIE